VNRVSICAPRGYKLEVPNWNLKFTIEFVLLTLFGGTAMNRIIGLFVLVVILASPVWTTAIVLMLPRRMFALSVAACALQLVLAYLVWWFFWGGGVGEEAHLSQAWQLTFALASLPVLATTLRRSGHA
jgi:hypothetical protein